MVRRRDTEALAAQAERFGFPGLLKWIKEKFESEPDRLRRTNGAVVDRSAKAASESPRT
jgi:hypothetical protein